MVLPDDAAAALAARHGRLIATLAQAQFVRMLGLIRGGMAAREAIAQAQTGFSGAFFDQLSAAFSELLQRAVGVAEVKALPVGPISLSRRLYLNDVQTQAETLALVRQHAQGLHQARTLALRLYDGYDPATAAERPLEGRARAELPKALRALTADPVTRESLQALIKRGQAQVARLTSSALRAAYSEAFDAWAAGQGDAALTRRLDVAWREKNRFMAERIAQTELARAHQAQRAQELMADDSIEVVQVMLNPRHPVADICDLHGRANLWGLGPGCYPKARAPRPPFHPFCWCVLRSRPDLEAADARPSPSAEAAYLAGLPLHEAGRVMGSKARAMAVMSGASVESVLNAGKDPLYRLQRLGDGGGHALVAPESPAPMPAKPTIAKAIPDQPSWKDLGLPDLKDLSSRAEPAPERMAAAGSLEGAVDVVRAALGMPVGGSVTVTTPRGPVEIKDSSLQHVVEKRQDQRERYASFILPTLQRPTEVWSVKYDDGSTRDRYIKLFSGTKYDILVMVKVTEDGSVFWNMMHRDRGGMNALRIGDLAWRSH